MSRSILRKGAMAEPIVSRLHRMRLLYAVVAALTAIWPVTGAQQSAVPSDDATLTHVLAVSHMVRAATTSSTSGRSALRRSSTSNLPHNVSPT